MNRSLILAVGIVLVVLLSGCDELGLEHRERVTIEHYGKVKEGMTYDEVVRAVGIQYTDESSMRMYGGEHRSLVWTNGDGSGMQVQLENGRVAGVMQFDLH